MKTFVGILLALATLYLVHSLPENYKKPQGYFQYINVSGPKEYEFGWKRGNPDHFISRFEQAKDHKFRTRVKWADTKDGYGEHYFEYNHGPKPKHSKGHDDHQSHGGYGHDDHKPIHGYGHDDHKPIHDYGHDDHKPHQSFGHADLKSPHGYGHDDHKPHQSFGHVDLKFPAIKHTY